MISVSGGIITNTSSYFGSYEVIFTSIRNPGNVGFMGAVSANIIYNNLTLFDRSIAFISGKIFTREIMSKNYKNNYFF